MMGNRADRRERERESNGLEGREKQHWSKWILVKSNTQEFLET
jgi:hypothetical protein